MAIADFGGKVLGNTIEFMVTDHQNKPDLGSQKFREWADRDGLTMVLGGSNTGVSIAMSPSRRKRRHPSSQSGRPARRLRVRTARPTRSIMPTIRPRLETAPLQDDKQGGKSWFFLTADYAFGTQLQDAAAKVVEANGGKVVGAVRVPLSTSDFSIFLLQAQNSGAQVLGLANAGNDFTNSLKIRRRIRHRENDEACRTAGLHQ